MVTFTGTDVPSPQEGVMNLSVKDLKELGYEEIHRSHSPCAAKTIDGCLIYEDRPTLCRSYYCHGKHWRPKGQGQLNTRGDKTKLNTVDSKAS
jgi:Fe-S-cluster containining protein